MNLLVETRLALIRMANSLLGRETFVIMGLKTASVGLTFLSTVLLARLLGPDNYGVYTYVYALIALLSVPSEFGLTTLVVRETARSISQKDYPLVKGIWRWSNRVSAIIGFIVIFLISIHLVFFNNALTGVRLETFLWGLVLIPLVVFRDLRIAALRGLHRIVAGQLPESLIRPGIFVLLLVGTQWLFTNTLSAPIAMILYVIAAAFALLASIWLLRQNVPDEVSHISPHYNSKAWLMSALPLTFLGGMQLVNQQIAIIIQGFFLSDTQIGIFRVATQISMLATFGLLVVNVVVAPRFAALYIQKNMLRLQNLVTKSPRVVLLFTIFIAIGFAVLGDFFLGFFFGEGYNAAYLPLLVMLLGQIINSITGSVGVLLNMTGNESYTLIGVTISAIVNVGLNLILVPSLGILGSAWATTISLFIWNSILWYQVKKRLRINSLAFYFGVRKSH